METKVAVVVIVIENNESAQEINGILHDYSDYVNGRMGLPYRQKGIHIITVAVDAPSEKISDLCGKIDSLAGVSVNVIYC